MWHATVITTFAIIRNYDAQIATIFQASRNAIHVVTCGLSVKDAQRDIEPAKQLNAKSKRFWVDFEPPTFRLTAERANRLHHRSCHFVVASCQYKIRWYETYRTLNEIFLAWEYIYVLLQLCVRDVQRDMEPAKRLNARDVNAAGWTFNRPSFRLTAERANWLRHRSCFCAVASCNTNLEHTKFTCH